MKTLSCDDCGKELRKPSDMIDGKFMSIVNYHPHFAHISTINIEFEKDHGRITPPPDLCKKCMTKHLIKAIKEG